MTGGDLLTCCFMTSYLQINDLNNIYYLHFCGLEIQVQLNWMPFTQSLSQVTLKVLPGAAFSSRPDLERI